MPGKDYFQNMDIANHQYAMNWCPGYPIYHAEEGPHRRRDRAAWLNRKDKLEERAKPRGTVYYRFRMQRIAARIAERARYE